MKSIFRLPNAGLALLILVAGCATQPGVNQPPPPYVQKLGAMGVAPQTVNRISNARVLTFADVLEMVKKGVPGDKIVAYLKSTRAPYNYSQAQINQLVDAGADSTLTNYVGRSQGDFLIDAQNAAQQEQLRQNAKFSKEFWDDPYFADPDFWGPIPFGFGWPALWY